MDTKMKQFKPIDPLTIESDTRIFGKLVDHEAAYRDNIYYLAVDDTHAIIATHSYYTDPDTNESEWLTYQLEFPKAGLRWIVDTINNKFFKDRKSTRLNSSHVRISYAVFCLKKKNKNK